MGANRTATCKSPHSLFGIRALYEAFSLDAIMARRGRRSYIDFDVAVEIRVQKRVTLQLKTERK